MGNMGDLGLFALGLLIGALAPAFPGFFAGSAVALAFSIICGVSDGKRHARLRWVWSWAPALLGLLIFPVFLISIFKEQLYGPRALHNGLTLSFVLAILSGVAAAFVAVTLSVSVLTRRRWHRITKP